MLKISCAITGDDYSMVRLDTPKSKKKVNAMASAVFIPVMMWFINAYLLMRYIMDSEVVTALVTAFICSLLIFMIERNIVMSKGAAAAATRIILGFVIAILGAVSLDEVIFKKDIDQQMARNQLKFIEHGKRILDENNKLERSRIEDEINTKYIAWSNALENARKEADGTGGSGQKGVHGITKIKLQIAKEKEIDYQRSVQVLDEFIDMTNSEKDKLTKSIEASFQDAALLSRIKAMFDLIRKDKMMQGVYLLFSILLFMLEFIVVITKFSWTQTNYEKKVELIEKIGASRMEQIFANDHKHFIPGKMFPLYKNANTTLKKAANSSMIF